MERKEQCRRRYSSDIFKIRSRRGNEAEGLEFSRNSILRVAVGPLGNTELLPGFGAWFLELFWDLELGIWSFHPAVCIEIPCSSTRRASLLQQPPQLAFIRPHIPTQPFHHPRFPPITLQSPSRCLPPKPPRRRGLLLPR